MRHVSELSDEEKQELLEFAEARIKEEGHKDVSTPASKLKKPITTSKAKNKIKEN